ncbi:hypothetical protein WJX73_001160 [Symbiochloris irregularis]|uniref:Maintenance of Photosystem II under High light 2 C-terminal domain-containing protein n=1 Tax=Symbiochloris irregularis TaxID=706552 RepID=A0AAW1PZY2_9CHLO
MTLRAFRGHINRLAKSGSEIDTNKLSDAATTLNDKWVSQFETAASNIAAGDSNKSAGQVLQAIQSLKSSAKGGDLKDAKRKYVAAVSAIQNWVGASGVEGIRGL